MARDLIIHDVTRSRYPQCHVQRISPHTLLRLLRIRSSGDIERESGNIFLEDSTKLREETEESGERPHEGGRQVCQLRPYQQVLTGQSVSLHSANNSQEQQMAMR